MAFLDVTPFGTIIWPLPCNPPCAMVHFRRVRHTATSKETGHTMSTSDAIGAMAWVETAYLLTDLYWRVSFASDAAGLPFGRSPNELEGRTLEELLGVEVFDE